MGGIYKVVLNGSYLGKDNQSTLWYRTAVDVFGGVFGFGGAVTLVDAMMENLVPAWLKCKPTDYVLQTIDVYPHNDLFELAYQMPYKRTIEAHGTSGAFGVGTDGPGLCVNFRFNLEPVLLGPQRLYAPRNGYIAIGPIPSNLIDNYGKLADTFMSQDFEAFGDLANFLCANLDSIAPPAVFFPVRISQKWGIVGDVLTLLGWGWADVQSGSYDRYVSYRRTRRITG